MAYTPPAEFREILDKLLDAPPLSRTETARLEEYLEDDQALLYYLQITQQESLISGVLTENVEYGHPKQTKWSLKQPILWASAACILFSLGLLLGHKMTPAVPKVTTIENPIPKSQPTKNTNHKKTFIEEDFLPQITGLFGVRWSDTSNSFIPNPKDLLKIDSGIIELTYPNGVQVILEGPASYQASGGNGGSLDFGRLVASVPPGAEGFEVNYQHGKVVDLGTEFGMDVSQDGVADIGVFDGEVEVHAPDNPSTDVRLVTENQALRHKADSINPIQSIPFDQSKYIRHTPSRDFPWKIENKEQTTVSFDVSHLIWRGARFTAVFKWMNGFDGIQVNKVQLFKDDKPIVTNTQHGLSGIVQNTHSNTYNLELPQEQYSRAKWTIVATIQIAPREPKDTSLSVETNGIMQLVEDVPANTTKEAFVGSWEYMHNGKKFIRHFFADGSMSFEINGNKGRSENKWEIVENRLRLHFPHENYYEDHLLLDSNTLIFTNQPYANAVKVDQ